MESDSSSDDNNYERQQQQKQQQHQQQQQKVAEPSKESKTSSKKKNREESSSSSMSEGEDVVKVAVVDNVPVVDDVAPVVDVAKVDSKSRSNRKYDTAEGNVETTTDPGMKFQISSYHSFVPVVRKSPNILEKIKLFSPTSDEMPDFTIKNNFTSSFNPLLPKEFSGSSNAIESRHKTLPLRNKTNLISTSTGDLNDKIICPPPLNESNAKKSFEREIICGLKKDIKSKFQTKGAEKTELDHKSFTQTEQPVVSVANLAKHFSNGKSDEIQIIEKEKKKADKLICILPDNENEEELLIKLSQRKMMEDKLEESKAELSEDVKLEIKVFAKSLNERNRGFVDQCLLRDKKMLKDCNMGDSSYRDWNLESGKSKFGQIRKNEEIISDKTHLISPSPKRNLEVRRNSQPLNEGSEKKPTESRMSRIPRAKSVETEMGRWDCFLKEIGRLSIEIDDENETFI